MRAPKQQNAELIPEEILFEPSPLKIQIKNTEAKNIPLKRPQTRGKFLYVDNKKFWIHGVTYGTFRPDEEGHQFPDRKTVRKDFALMVSNKINTIRIYTPPPIWLLDLAEEFGLRIMLGLPWEQHVTFLDKKKTVKNIKRRVREMVKPCAGHPAILCYSIGNEIPTNIVRWHGPKRVERFLKNLYDIVKEEDPESLVTYVNFPPTEYLQLPFLDLFCFNVYLETREKLDAYLARLQILAGDKPMIMAEIGLDSIRNGGEKQAKTLKWQIRTALSKGAAGVFLFSWTDEWYRGGADILDWGFGLTTRERKPKPALKSVRKAFRKKLLAYHNEWPFVSIAICTLNGGATLRECMDSLFELNYPHYEVILVSDGSTDNTVAIAEEYDCKIIATENRGLSSARNTAWQAAEGELVVYIDDDAYPDPEWLTYLALVFLETDYAAVGGPNIPPPDDGLVAACVSNAPGGPIHVLLSDEEAEHIPGCNMAFRKSVLEEIGGFDPLFRVAGDDVDVCWRIQEAGYKIGFSPTAVVWHHRRNKVKSYYRQQKGYGKAEALLENKWPQKFNFAGHLNWGGRLYTSSMLKPLLFTRNKIEYGVWGTGFFQSLYERDPNHLLYMPLLPEWYMLVGALLGLSSLGLIWSPMLWLLPFALLAFGIVVVQAIVCTLRVSFENQNNLPIKERIQMNVLTWYLYLIQPLARLAGRLEFGLTLWRRRHNGAFALPKQNYYEIWNEDWKSKEDWLTRVEYLLEQNKVQVKRGGIHDDWDLELREGMSSPTRIVLAIEEHGSGKQLLRFRIWPKYPPFSILLTLLFLGITTIAAFDHAWLAAIILGSISALLGFHLFQHSLPVTKACLQELEPNYNPSLQLAFDETSK